MLEIKNRSGRPAFFFAAAFLLLASEFAVAQQTATPAERDVLQKMLDLFARDKKVQAEACKWLGETRDISVAPALVDALHYMKLPPEWDWAIGQVTGQPFGRDWPRWMEWLGRQNFQPHPVYAHFKQIIFSSIDPAFGKFLDPAYEHTIRLDEVLWGGVRKDGIPALDDPHLLSAGEATYLNDDDDVFGLSVNGEHHAYPLRILNWHEMLNTEIGGIPISLTYCTLCGAAIPYEGSIGDTTFTFGSSGFLYRSNKLMYDRQTQTLWSSLQGEPVLGPLVGKNIRLKRRYVVRTSWRAWRELHPDTRVLDINTGYNRDYRPGAAYADYFKSKDTMFPVAWRDKRLKAKDWVYGLILNGQQRAYPLKKMKKHAVLNDTFAGQNVLILSDAKQLTVRAYARGEVAFAAQIAADRLRDRNGNEWQMTEAALVRVSGGARLPRLPGHLAYWFGWYAFFPQTQVWEKP